MDWWEKIPRRGLGEAERPPASKPLRTLRAISLYLLFFAGPYVADRILQRSRGYTEVSALADFTQVALLLGAGVVFLILSVRHVSYRPRDVWIFLIPLYGYLWAMKIVWRVAYLPYRDWPPRTDESERLVRIDVKNRDIKIYRRM